MNGSKRTSLIILAAFAAFFAVWYFNLGVKPFETIVRSSQTAHYLVNYLVAGLIPAAAMWWLHRSGKTMLEQLGIGRGCAQGAIFALLSTLPMVVGYALLGKFDREVSADHLLTRVVIAGFFEELIFRGFVFGQLFRTARWGFLPAALLTAAAFGSLHLYQGHDFASALGAFAVTGLGSLFFSWIYVEWNYNLWSVIWLHTLMNLPWILFRASASGAVGDSYANLMRIATVVLAIGLTISYKKLRKLPYSIRANTLIMNRLTGCLLAALLLAGCASRPETDERTLYVSIQPLRSIVEGIVGDDFAIEVLVPPGANPETFEPTPRQFVGLNRARLVFNVGLIDFETTLLSKVEDPQKVVNLSDGIELIAGSCSHGHNGHNGHNHAHGVDPHVWTSPKALLRMAANAYEAIRQAYPDSTQYATNYNRLAEKLRETDRKVARRIAASGADRFIVYHPALTYYARDYGLQQIAIESDGKEPSARQLAQLIREARAAGVKRIFYQREFPASTVEVIASDIGARPVEIDPLREDAAENILEITELITER